VVEKANTSIFTHINQMKLERIDIPYGFVQGDEVYLAPYLGFPARRIGEVKNSVEESTTYFIERFNSFETKVLDLEAAILEAENKGSFLMKLLHLKNSIATFDGLGDFEPLQSKLNELENYLNEIIAKNRIRNTEIKQELLKEASGFKRPMDWKAATESILEIKAKWLRTGNAEEEYNDQLEAQFKEAIDSFFQRKKDHFEEKKIQIDARIISYENIIEQVNKANSLSIGEVKIFEEKWKSIGKIPLIKIKEFNQKFFSILKSKKKSTSIDLPQVSVAEQELNLKAKREIILKLQSIDLDKEADPQLLLNNLKIEWRNTGVVPRDDSRKLNDDFNNTYDTLSERISLNDQAASNDKNYHHKNSRERARIQMRLLKDGLARDEKELQVFYDNLHKTLVIPPENQIVLEQKINKQKHKIQIKKMLLRSMKQALDSI
jgi:hypothetical protein